MINVFISEVKNWKEVGGKDQRIVVTSCTNGSDTRTAFEKRGLDGAKPVRSQEQDPSGTVRKIVEQVPGIINYLTFSYMDGSTVALSVNSVEPKKEYMKDNSWRVWSYEHMYTKGEPNREIRAFLNYMVTGDVQKTVIKDLGCLAITDMQVERDVNGEVTRK